MRELLVGRDFFGVHPWETLGEFEVESLKLKVGEELRSKLLANPKAGVLHGAKCWGQVVAAVKRMIGGGLAMGGKRQAFLFHGFSRSGGLIPEIAELNGFISVGPAVLNDHAVNYRELVKKIPLDRLLVETDAVVGARVPTRPHIRDVLVKTADILNLSAAELEKTTDENADRFLGAV